VDVVRYFCVAFNLQVSDVKRLKAWKFFTGAIWSEETVNAKMTPVLFESLKKVP
jgi:hypothetical protein